MVGSWQSKLEVHFKTCYQPSGKVINGIAKNMRMYRKFVRALDKQWWSIFLESGSFIYPSKHLKDNSGKVDLLRKPLKSKSHKTCGGSKKKSDLIAFSCTELYREDALPQDYKSVASLLILVSENSVQVCRFIIKSGTGSRIIGISSPQPSIKVQPREPL